MEQISENRAAIQNNTDQIKENADGIKENAIQIGNKRFFNILNRCLGCRNCGQNQ